MLLVSRIHDLRHSYCSQLSASGVDLNLIRVWAGHTDFKVTLRYAHLQPLDHAARAAVLDGAPATAPEAADEAENGDRAISVPYGKTRV